MVDKPKSLRDSTLKLDLMTFLDTGAQSSSSNKNVDIAKPAFVHPYDVYVVNTSNWQIYATVDINGQEHAVNPPIGKTCSADIQTCKDNGSYSLLITSDCAAQPYQFKIRAVYPPTGKKGETGYQSVTPSCEYPGEVSQFDQADPTS